jgi:hypothetical protein
VLAFSRILNNQEVLVVANASTRDGFAGYVLVDAFLNGDGDRYRVLNGSGATPPDPVETHAGLETHEIDGGVTSGPAKMMRVSLRPMEVQILAR